jgi:hypothetical protein
MIGFAAWVILSPFYELYRMLLPYSPWAILCITCVVLYFLSKFTYHNIGTGLKRKRLAFALLLLPFVHIAAISSLAAVMAWDTYNGYFAKQSVFYQNQPQAVSLSDQVRAAENIFSDNELERNCIWYFVKDAVLTRVQNQNQSPQHQGILSLLSLSSDYQAPLDVAVNEIISSSSDLRGFYTNINTSRNVEGPRNSLACAEHFRLPAAGQ